MHAPVSGPRVYRNRIVNVEFRTLQSGEFCYNDETRWDLPRRTLERSSSERVFNCNCVYEQAASKHRLAFTKRNDKTSAYCRVPAKTIRLASTQCTVNPLYRSRSSNDDAADAGTLLIRFALPTLYSCRTPRPKWTVDRVKSCQELSVV